MYDAIPTIVTTFVAIVAKISIFIFLLEIVHYTSNFLLTYQFTWTSSLLLSSLLSLIIGTIVGLAQTRIKRLLAYSTISHIGFILLALAINTEQSIDSFIFYILQYSITNLNIFLIIMALGFIIHKEGIKIYSNSNNLFLFDYDIRFLSTFKGQIVNNPILSFSLIICLFSMAGIPPFLGFFSKQFVLLSAVESGYWFMSFVAIITSVISASYYLRLVVLLVTGSAKEHSNSLSLLLNNISTAKLPLNSSVSDIHTQSILTNFHSFLISTITLSILLFIFKPTLILNSTQLLSLSLFNY